MNIVAGIIAIAVGGAILLNLGMVSKSFDDSQSALRPVGSEAHRPLVLGAMAAGFVPLGIVFIVAASALAISVCCRR
jgi:hypothetical protein